MLRDKAIAFGTACMLTAAGCFAMEDPFRQQIKKPIAVLQAANMKVFCGRSNEVTADLMTYYGQGIVAYGQGQFDTTFALWYGPRTNKYTVTITTKDGRTCFVVDGIGIETTGHVK